MERGMIIKTKEGKSAILVSICGPHSRHAKKVVANAIAVPAAGLHLFSETTNTQLGGVINFNTSMGPELTHRHIAVRSISDPGRYRITGEASSSRELNATVIDSLVLASVCHNSHTWCGMTVTQWNIVSARVAAANGSAAKDNTLPIRLLVLL